MINRGEGAKVVADEEFRKVAEFYGVSEEYAQTLVAERERERRIDRKVTRRHIVRLLVMVVSLGAFLYGGYRLVNAVNAWLHVPDHVWGWGALVALAYWVNREAARYKINDPRDKD